MNNARKIDFGFHVLLILALAGSLLIDTGFGTFCILVAQFFIGIYQLLSSIGRTVKFHSFDRTIQQYIILYWIGVAAYALGWVGLLAMDYSRAYTLPYLFAAWVLAFYYCYITYLLAFPNYIKSHLDI